MDQHSMYLPVTTLLTSTLAIWLFVLSWRVIQKRRSVGGSKGAADDAALKRAIRGQGNLVEYAPMFILLIAVAEVQGMNGIVLGLISIAFVLGRFAHGYAFSFVEKSIVGRQLGMGLTFGAILMAAIFNVIALVV